MGGGGGGGEGGVGWDPPSSQGPPMVVAEGGPKYFKLQLSWRRSKTLAVSLKHWKKRRGGGGGLKGGGVPPPPPTGHGPSNRSLVATLSIAPVLWCWGSRRPVAPTHHRSEGATPPPPSDKVLIPDGRAPAAAVEGLGRPIDLVAVAPGGPPGGGLPRQWAAAVLCVPCDSDRGRKAAAAAAAAARGMWGRDKCSSAARTVQLM